MNKKPTLTLAKGKTLSIEDITKMYKSLTGKDMTEEEIAYGKAKLKI